MQPGRATFFQTPADHKAFLALLRGVAETWCLNLVTYCLLPRRYHLLLQTTFPNLSHCMLRINAALARRIRRLGTSQERTLFGRYKVTLLDPEHYLLPVARRVHQAPLRHGCAQGLHHPWSSYRAYLGGESGRLLAKRLLLERLPGDPRERRQAFQRFMALPEEQVFASRYRRGAFPRVLGNDAFIAHCLDAVGQAHGESASAPRVGREDILVAVRETFQTTANALGLGGQGIPNTARAAYMHLLRTRRGETLADIAAHCGLARHSSVGSALKRFEALLRKDPDLRATLRRSIARLDATVAASTSPLFSEASED
jgi:putative transposase